MQEHNTNKKTCSNINMWVFFFPVKIRYSAQKSQVYVTYESERIPSEENSKWIPSETLYTSFIWQSGGHYFNIVLEYFIIPNYVILEYFSVVLEYLRKRIAATPKCKQGKDRLTKVIKYWKAANQVLFIVPLWGLTIFSCDYIQVVIFSICNEM